MPARTTMNDDCILAPFDPRSSHGDRRFPVSAWSTNSSPVRVSTLLTVNGSKSAFVGAGLWFWNSQQCQSV